MSRCEDFPCCGHYDEDGTFCPVNTHSTDDDSDVRWFVNEDGGIYPYPASAQARDFPNDHPTAYLTAECAGEAADALMDNGYSPSEEPGYYWNEDLNSDSYIAYLNR